MNKIEYNGETYQPCQFWPLVRALGINRHSVSITCNVDPPIGMEYYARSNNGIAYYARSPFLALGKLVDEIKKQEAAK